MDEHLENFPGLKKVEFALEKFRSEGFPKFKDDDTIQGYIKKITDILTRELNVFPNMMINLEREDFVSNLFRVRPTDQIENINLFSQHSYPPSAFVKFGRCNFPKFPVFYSSNNPMTSLIEVARESGGEDKRYCVSKWKVNSSQNLLIQTFMQMQLPEGHDYEEFQKSQKEKINQPFENKLTDDQCAGLLALLRFLDESFINDRDYAISASLAHRVFYAKHRLKTDILIYPSVQSKFNGLNFAVHPNYVDNHMQIDRFYILDLKRFDPIKLEADISIIKYGLVDKNNIHWKNIDPNDEVYMKVLKEDFGTLFDSGNSFSFVKI